VKKLNTRQERGSKIFKERNLTTGLDLGDRSSYYCVLDEAGEVIQERSVSTNKKAMAKVFGSMGRYRIALEVGTHSPWVSRSLRMLGHEVVVANPRQVKLISSSSQKDDRLDAQTLARSARVDLQLLRPIQHRSAEAQRHPMVIRVRAAAVQFDCELASPVEIEDPNWHRSQQLHKECGWRRDDSTMGKFR
jgi:hypothetical protein